MRERTLEERIASLEANVADHEQRLGHACPDFPPGTVLRHHVDGSHSIVLVEEPMFGALCDCDAHKAARASADEVVR